MTQALIGPPFADQPRRWIRLAPWMTFLAAAAVALHVLRPSDPQNVVEDVLLFCEHPHVITLGRSGNRSNLLASEKILRQKGQMSP